MATQQKFISHGSGGCKMPAWLGEGLLPDWQPVPSCFLHKVEGRKGWGLCRFSFTRGLLPFLGTPPSWPKHLPNDPYLLIPSQQGLGFNINILRWYKYSDHSTHKRGIWPKSFSPRISKTDIIPTTAYLECLSLPCDLCQHFQPFLCKCSRLWVPSTLPHPWSQASSSLSPATRKTLITFPFSYSQRTLSLLSFPPLFGKFFPSSCFHYQTEDFTSALAHTQWATRWYTSSWLRIITLYTVI